MVVYNITIKVEWPIDRDWVEWMKDTHMPEILATGCFESGRILRLVEVDETDGPTYAVQFTAPTREDYNRYITQFATELRSRSFEKWGDRFIAFRSVMELVH